MEKIELFIDYTESVQLIDQTHSITLDNGDDVSFNITADVTVSSNIGATFYDELQSTITVENLEVEILGIWNDEGKVYYTPAQEKELKTEILKWIE